MENRYKQATDFLVALGIEQVPHTGKTYLGHLIAVYRLMKERGCDEELCQAGMFHSIYGTEKFQGFKLPLERRAELRDLIGMRAEHLAYCNCAMDRASFDRTVEENTEPFHILDRLTGDTIALSAAELDDLCAVHLYDWLEQAPRSRYGLEYRQASYRRMAERLGDKAVAAYNQVFSLPRPDRGARA
jgi:hypothetical protein